MLWDFVVVVFKFSPGRFTVTAFPALRITIDENLTLEKGQAFSVQSMDYTVLDRVCLRSTNPETCCVFKPAVISINSCLTLVGSVSGLQC